jgi:tetratricopeptide (TPR) repeat protein
MVIRGHMTDEPVFVSTETTQDGNVYETYRASDAEAAKAFLLTKRVDRDLYYIVVETPCGNWGMDVEGLYLENLLHWQLDAGPVDCAGQIHSLPNRFGVVMAAQGNVDNFVVRVRCGRCAHLWYDGVRYQNTTLVRCPSCKARNTVDSCGAMASTPPGQQATAVISSHPILGQAANSAGITNDPVAALAAIDEAIEAARVALTATPPGHPHRPGRLFHFGSMLEERFGHTNGAADLDRAITVLTDAVHSTSPDDTEAATRHAAVGRTCQARFDRTGELDDLNAAISALRSALAGPPPDPVDLRYRLGVALRDRFVRIRQLADLNEAVTACRDAASGTRPEETRHATFLAVLSTVLRFRFEHAGRHDDLTEAIAVARAAAADAGPGHPFCHGTRTVLGLALQERFTAAGEHADLTEAIAAFTDAVAATSPGAPNYGAAQHNLSRSLLRRFQETGELADLTGAVAAARAATAVVTRSEPDYAVLLGHLGATLVEQFTRLGRLNDLDDGIAAHRVAVSALPPDHSDRPRALDMLGVALLARSKHNDQLADLNTAIDTIREAVNSTSTAHPDRPRYLNTLGTALQNRFERTASLADLDEAVVSGREATAGTARGHTHYPAHLANFAVALHTRFGFTANVADLDEAIAANQDVLAIIGPDHPDSPVVLSNLGSTLTDRYHLSNAVADLESAVAACRDAVAAIPADHPSCHRYLHGLSHTLRIRYLARAEPGDLDEAIAIGRAAVAGAPPDRPGRSHLVNLAVLLIDRSVRDDDPSDLDEAIAIAETAVAGTPATHPRQVQQLSLLGTALMTRFERSGQQADLEQAIVAFSKATRVESSPPLDRMHAARRWGRAAIQAGHIDSAADGLAVAVQLLPQFAWHGLPHATREERIGEWNGLAADAAACAIRAGRPQAALELLEAGRSVIWNQLFSLRTDLTDLTEHRPELAERLNQIRAALNAPLPTSTAPPAPSPDIKAGPGPWSQTEQNHAGEERMRLALEFDELVRRIRAITGFEKFLEPTPFSQLREAASGGPVAIINTSQHGCHALMVSTTSVQVVELPDLTHAKVTRRAADLVRILGDAAKPDRPPLERERDRHTFLGILTWLWDAVAEPVLTTLGYTGPPAPGETPPRVWWCPTGPLTLLPLHAAGHHREHGPGDPTGADTVPDRVISSYSPTLTALLRARGTPVPAGVPTLLAIGMPTTPGAGDLPAVPDELDRVHAHCPIATRLESPARGQAIPAPGNEPTVARVSRELSHHTWAHFACHGSQHFSDPTASAFWLTDGPLRIADLIHHGTGPRHLAFLSACQTATGSIRVVDEAIHLAAAMQLLGYRNVIAALWSISDSLAPEVADTVYATLATTAPPDAAYALHRAVTAIRTRWPVNPLAWAPYLHTGP